jgi:4-hydroxy-3-polyprenylbenzoate decarboxylase
MPDLSSFLNLLEREKQLARVNVEVDPEYEITEIATRTVKQQGPALLFERVKGSDFPLAINILGTDRRVELALGRHPQQVGDELKRLLEIAMPPRPRTLLQEWKLIGRVLSMPPKRVVRAACQQIEDAPDLSRWPILKCWPKDAGRFLTCGMVLTHDPDTDKRNLGIYRMQVVGPDQVLMHWQIQKGGGFHYWKAEQAGASLAVSVIIGGDPVLYLAAVAPLPEGIDEIAFAGFLRGKNIPLVLGKSKMTVAPADAEMVIEGIVAPDERMPEGPFGDHFGHYSHPRPCPVMKIQHVTRRRQPIYQAAVVGKPPQEDRYIGNAVQEIMLPLARLIHPEIRDMWAFYETGFHSLAVVSVVQRFGKEGMKAAIGLMGTGQMALTKCIILVDADVNARDADAVLKAVRDHFDPAEDFLLLPGVPFDTLDFTSFTLNLGSKMVLDATSASPAGPGADRRSGTKPAAQAGLAPSEREITALHPNIQACRVVDECLVAVQVSRDGRAVLDELVKHPKLAFAKLIAVVSPDVNLKNRESLLWGIFTRFDPARDVVFTETTVRGAWPVSRGRMGIDATFKSGYPDPVEMDPRIIQLVDERWHQYWTA